MSCIGIRAPRVARANEKGEIGGLEAQVFATHLLQDHDVSVTFSGVRSAVSHMIA